MDLYANELIAALLISLRIAPTFAFAPPFTLLRAPATIRLLLALSISLWIVLANPALTSERLAGSHALIAMAWSELVLGMTQAIGLQLAFEAVLTSGRAVDIQVGFGLAQVADPTLRQQMPLVGMLFSYAAGAVFFTTGGPADLLAIWSHSVAAVPLGALAEAVKIDVLLSYISAVFLVGVAIAGLVLLVLFLVDIAIAFMSRTLPQMNVLVLGFQVKTLALLVTLPFVFAFSGSLFLRLVRLAIDVTPQLI
jgi:flagellar biosynthetic protein FliR